MDWTDEDWIKVYTRDTAEWLCLPYRSRVLFLELLRKTDHAGVMQVGRRGVEAVAVALHAPQDEIEAALPALLEDGCVVMADGRLVIPNKVPAQSARTSDRLRKQMQRERTRDEALAGGSSSPVGEVADDPVTARHTPSQDVTRRHESPQEREESREIRSRTARAEEAGHQEGEEAGGEENRPDGRTRRRRSPLPYKPADVFAALESSSGGRFAGGPTSAGVAIEINKALRQMAGAGVTLADLRVVGEFIAAWNVEVQLGPEWVAMAKDGKGLRPALVKAKAWAARGKPPLGQLARGTQPGPNGARDAYVTFGEAFPDRRGA